MSDEFGNIEAQEQDDTAQPPKKKSIWHGFKVFFICMIILAAFIPIFGKIIPKLLFGTEELKQPPSQSVEISDTKPADIKQEEEATPPTATVESVPAPTIEETTKAIEPTIAPIVPDAAQNDENNKKIAELENQLKTLQSEFDNKVNILTLMAKLKDDVNSGKPYSNHLNQIKFALQNDSEATAIISAIMENAETGVLTTEKLKSQFPKLARLALQDKNSNFFMSYLQKFIFIRKVGDIVGDDDEAVIARAEQQLSENNLLAATNELAKLSADAQNVFAAWLLDAHNQLKTEENLDKLQIIVSQSSMNKQP